MGNPMQCNPSTGYCWCVDPQGNLRRNITTFRGLSKKCEVGCCEIYETGTKKPLQYIDAIPNGMCSVSSSSKRVIHHAGASCQEVKRYTKCQAQNSLDKYNCAPGKMNCNITKCDVYGLYQPKQCFGGVCFCVDT